MTQEPVRVLLVDDDELVLRSYVSLLEKFSQVKVVGAANSAVAACEMLQIMVVDVALVDVEMPGTDGISLAREIMGGRERTRVVMMTAFEVPQRLAQALDEGVQGYLTKDMPVEHIVMGVQQAARGGMVLGPGPAAHVIAQRRAARRDEGLSDVLASLPQRFQRLLPLVAEGRSNREIAALLGYTEGSVRTYMSDILRATGCRSRTELALAVAGCAGSDDQGAGW